MKRNLFIFALLAAFVQPAALRAQQDSPTAAAEREQAEERYRTVIKRLEAAEESNAALQRNVTALREEIRRLKDELDRSKTRNDSAVSQETIKYLGEKIEEVDKKRQADNERTLKEIEKVRKFLLEGPGLPRGNPSPPADGNHSRTNRVSPPRNPGSPPRADTGGKQTGWDYAIRDKDTLAGIVAALRKQGINVTQKQIEQANEGVNWNKLKIGQVIFIPAP